MRPHNKSILWDEYLEHYDKHRKYFNTKHKKAFCKRCIFKAIDDLDRSPGAGAEFRSASVLVSWAEWKYHQAFERVEAISGRSSNMQRHIKTCHYITPEDRARVMANFEASQRREEESTDGHLRLTRIGPRSRSATSHSDDDGSSSTSSVPSPDFARREFVRSILAPSVTSARPSPKLSLQSILNDDEDIPTYPYGGMTSRGKSPAVRPSTMPTLNNSFSQSGLSNNNTYLEEEHCLVARLDTAIDEIQQVRTRLDAQTIHQNGHYSISSEDNAATIAWMKRKLEEVRRDNEWLKHRVSATENDNSELKRKLERTGERLRQLEAGSRESRGAFGNGRSDSFRMMMTPRVNSEAVLVPPIEIEPESPKRRKVGEGGYSGYGFVPVNR